MNARYAAALADWSQRWHNGSQAWVHARVPFNPDDFGVKLISRETAVGFILQHHYARSVPALRKYRFGLYRTAGAQPELCGVIALSVPPRKEVLTGVFPRLEAYYESAEIGRMVLLDWPGHGAESWFLGEVASWLVRHTSIRGLVMFSDPEPRTRNDGSVLLAGHAGTSYQAWNAPCLGMSKASMIVLVDGLVFSNRARAKILNLETGWRYAAQMLTAAAAARGRELAMFDPARDDPRIWLPGGLRAAGAVRMEHGGCYKYAQVLGRNPRERRRVTMLGTPQPYPKLDLRQMRLF